jgi:hypothetical protein
MREGIACDIFRGKQTCMFSVVMLRDAVSDSPISELGRNDQQGPLWEGWGWLKTLEVGLFRYMPARLSQCLGGKKTRPLLSLLLPSTIPSLLPPYVGPFCPSHSLPPYLCGFPSFISCFKDSPLHTQNTSPAPCQALKRRPGLESQPLALLHTLYAGSHVDSTAYTPKGLRLIHSYA